MERRLLAFDLDRTIITDDYRLPPAIGRAIFRAREAGHHVAVLTGRPRAAAQPVLDELELRGPFSVNHGALVVGPDGNELRRLRMAWAEILALLTPFLEEGPDFSCVIDDTLYVRDPDDERWAWVHTRNRQVARFTPELALDADKVVFTTNGEGPHLEREILARHSHFVTYLWEDGYLEVTGPQTDKASALELICDTLGVPREHTIAFGDGLNDATMIAWAGHGVAVGPHAHESVLATAAERIPSPEDDGVARWLEQNLL